MTDEINTPDLKRVELAPPECIVCFEQINQGAILCRHCNTYQDWRRHFQFNTVVLSLLVALVTVLTASIPVIKSLILPIAQTQFSFVHYHNKQLVVVATNTGQQSAMYSGAALTLLKAGSSREVPLIAKKYSNKQPLYLKPNEWIDIALVGKSLEDDFALINVNEYDICKLTFFVLDLTHTVQKSTLEYECADMFNGK